MDLRGIAVDDRQLSSLARKWGISTLALFGSVLRSDFNATSDVDVLITFEPSSAVSVLDLVQIRDELGELFGRPVDLVEPDAITNPFRREAILGHTQTIYAA